MRLAAVILNYNDSLATLEAVRRAVSVPEIGGVIVVDNASTDDSIEVLRDGMEWLRKDGKLGRDAGKLGALIRSRKNGGYGSGNNIGVRYAARHFNARYCLIANPDADYTADLITGMLEVLTGESGGGPASAGTISPRDSGAALVGAVSASRYGAAEGGRDAAFNSAISGAPAGAAATGGPGVVSYDEFISSGWKKRNLAEEIIYSAPILKRVFKKAVNYPEAYYRNMGKNVMPVYAVHGSLMMADTGKFLDAGGFDEQFFLYMEESALAKRLERKGYRTYLLGRPYVHSGSHSISGAGFGAIRRQMMRQRSERLYYRKYLGAGACSMFLVRLIQDAVLAETSVYAVMAGGLGRD